jgi:hypothetical protein
MAVDKDSANWRLFGGGGLLAGGLIWLVGAIVAIVAAGPIAFWLGLIGVLLVGVALFFVAFGQTGSNGAVGASLFGKIVLVVFGVGYLLVAASLLLSAFGVGVSGIVGIVAGAFVIFGGLISAYAIFQRGVARGAAKWVLFVPAVLGVLFAFTSLFGLLSFGGGWPFLVLGLGFAVTGLLYLLNRKDAG